MINNLHKIGVVTGNVAKAEEFYTKILGLEVVERFPSDVGEDYVFMQAGSVKVELLPQKAMNAPEGVHHLSFRVESVDEGCAYLKSKGVKILVEPFDAGVGGIRLAFFEGPDGLRLQLFERKT
jgi:catechol 2,3-dioxygenase-like lactoylglutathione lyase family enzyme